MQVLIVGATRLARTVAEQLAHAGHDVTALEDGPRALEHGPLSEAARGRDAIATVTGDDATNAVVALAARQLLGVPLAVAVIADPARADALAGLGAHVVCPTTRTAHEIERTLRRSSMEAELTMGPGLAIYRADVPARLAGRALADLADPGVVIPVAVERAGQTHIAAPGLMLAERDVLHAATSDEERLARLMRP